MANPNTIGVAYSSSMIVPCMVNSWLNCSFDKNCIPGTASSARIIRAMRPPMRKNAIEVVKYMIPSTLGSVVVIILKMNEPLGPCRGG
ncbi:hypothetical protein MLGJGCBP_01436 [Rhodococcus sp. T7]|nr:hypothetical protein MLGJGCBP_01436 [Rhodococcus sp. T7]